MTLKTSVAKWNWRALEVAISTRGSVGYLYPKFMKPTTTRVPLRFSGYIIHIF